MEELAAIRREGREMTWVDAHGHARTYLRPDSKSGDGGIHPRQPSVAVRTIVVSTQHDEFITPSGTLTQEQADAAMQQEIAEDVRKVLLPRVKARLRPEEAALIPDDVELLVNPTGKFVIGGPTATPVSQAARSLSTPTAAAEPTAAVHSRAKDPSKVDRSAAYAARHMAKTLWPPG